MCTDQSILFFFFFFFLLSPLGLRQKFSEDLSTLLFQLRHWSCFVPLYDDFVKNTMRESLYFVSHDFSSFFQRDSFVMRRNFIWKKKISWHEVWNKEIELLQRVQRFLLFDCVFRNMHQCKHLRHVYFTDITSRWENSLLLHDTYLTVFLCFMLRIKLLNIKIQIQLKKKKWQKCGKSFNHRHQKKESSVSMFLPPRQRKVG